MSYLAQEISAVDVDAQTPAKNLQTHTWIPSVSEKTHPETFVCVFSYLVGAPLPAKEARLALPAGNTKVIPKEGTAIIDLPPPPKDPAPDVVPTTDPVPVPVAGK